MPESSSARRSANSRSRIGIAAKITSTSSNRSLWGGTTGSQATGLASTRRLGLWNIPDTIDSEQGPIPELTKDGRPLFRAIGFKAALGNRMERTKTAEPSCAAWESCHSTVELRAPDVLTRNPDYDSSGGLQPQA